MAGRTSIIADINREWGRWICDEPYLESTLASEQGAAQSISVEAEYLAPPHTIEHTQGRGHVATIDRGQNPDARAEEKSSLVDRYVPAIS